MSTKWSADGQWWWDGQQWLPARLLRRQPTSSDAPPSPSPPRSLLTFGAAACLGLALVSYLMLPTPLLVFVPVTSIISIAIGRAARHSLPHTAKRDRAIALVGIILAALPLGLVIIGIVLLQLVLGFSMFSGNH